MNKSIELFNSQETKSYCDGRFDDYGNLYEVSWYVWDVVKDDANVIKLVENKISSINPRYKLGEINHQGNGHFYASVIKER